MTHFIQKVFPDIFAEPIPPFCVPQVVEYRERKVRRKARSMLTADRRLTDNSSRSHSRPLHSRLLQRLLPSWHI